MASVRFRTSLWLAIIVIPAAGAAGQAQAVPPTAPLAVELVPPLPPTKLEAFKAPPGTLVMRAYDVLDSVAGMSAKVGEIRDARGNVVRGLVIDVADSDDHSERAFIDADEIAALVGGTDSLLALKSNPTRFGNFDVEYTTRGGLTLTALNQHGGDFTYSVEAGRDTRARLDLDPADMRALRDMFVVAQSRLGLSGK